MAKERESERAAGGSGARAKALRARYEIIQAALPRESSLPSTAHAPMSTWLSAPRRVSRARNSALRVSQGRG